MSDYDRVFDSNLDLSDVRCIANRSDTFDCVEPDYPAARRHLMKADPELGAVIKRVGPAGCTRVAPRDPFEALCDAIASQQLSAKAAARSSAASATCSRTASRRPDRVMTLTDDEIRAVGLQPTEGRASSRTWPATCSTAGSI